MAIIIGTVIEMILPEGNCKKYIKVVIGIYIVFTIVSPVITKFTGENISVSEALELDKYVQEAESSVATGNAINADNQNNIMSMYISGLKEDIAAKLKTKEYEVSNIEVEIADTENYTINSISLQAVRLQEDKETDEPETQESVNTVKKIESVEKVDIDLDNSKTNEEHSNTENDTTEKTEEKLSNKEIKEIKEYLSSVYEVREDNITINWNHKLSDFYEIIE